MRILLTGATGFIGSHVARALTKAGHEVIALRRLDSRPAVQTTSELRWITGTLEDLRQEHLDGCETLVHCAAVGVSPKHATWDEYVRWNVVAPLVLARRAAQAGVSRIISCGTCFEFGRAAELFDRVPADAPMEPTTPYGSSKAMATVGLEGLCRELSFELITLRLFHVYGQGLPAAAFWPSLQMAANTGADFPMTGGEQARDFTSAEEVADWFVWAVASRTPKSGWPLRVNVGSGRMVTLKSFAEEWWRRWGATGRLLVGAIPYRENEVMRYVPLIEDQLKEFSS